MNIATSYNEAVRERFANPRHAGELQGSYEQRVAADVSDSDKGARVVVSAGIRDGAVAEMAFMVWGCPHLIAALDLACHRLTGQPASSLENYDLDDITRELSVPAEKMGRILLLEDALATLWAQYSSLGN